MQLVNQIGTQIYILLLSTHKFCPWDHMYALITIALFSNYATKNLDVYRTMKLLALLLLLFGASPPLKKPLPSIHRPLKILQWRKNAFLVPYGKTGKAFIDKITEHIND